MLLLCLFLAISSSLFFPPPLSFLSSSSPSFPLCLPPLSLSPHGSDPHHMNAVDGLLLFVLLLSAVVGMWRGLVYEVLSLMVWVAAFLLAQAYARRDHVSLLAFKGLAAELILPPTRSLVQTKRRLAGMPGGRYSRSL